MREIKICELHAEDEKGRSIPKDVFLYTAKSYKGNDQWENAWGIAFGTGFCRYYLTTLLEDYPYPEGKLFCIDIMGRNHYGSPVNIKTEILNDTIKKALEKIKEMEKIEK